MALNVGVIGAGALGTAIAQTMSENVDELLLHVRKQELCDDINNTGYNTQYYPNNKLNENIKATTDINDLKRCSIIFLAIPSSAFRTTLNDLKEVLEEGTILVTTAKGIEYPSLKSMGDLISEYFDENYVALSGPNFASEIMLNQPTITNIASRKPENSQKVKEVLTTKQFKVKIIDDKIADHPIHPLFVRFFRFILLYAKDPGNARRICEVLRIRGRFLTKPGICFILETKI